MLKATLRDSLVYGVASVLSKGLAVLLLPLYTRVLSPGAYGVYDVLITLGALANLCVALEVSQGLARYWPEMDSAARRRELASTTFWFTAAAYGVFLLVALLAAPSLTRRLFGDPGLEGAFRLGMAFVALNGVYLLLLNQFRWELRSRAYAAVSCAGALLTLLFAAVFCLRWDMGLEGVMLAQLAATGCGVLLSLWLLRETLTLSFSFGLLGAMLRFSAPLVPAGLAVFVSLYLNRFALNHFGSLHDVGLFAIASRLAGMSVLLILGVQAALTPLVYRHHHEAETPGQVARLFGWFSAVALTACLFLGLFARELLMILSNAEFRGAAVLVPVLAPALLLSQMYIFSPGIAIRKKTVWQLWVTLLSAAVGVVANWWLVPAWGGLGAATATLLSALVFFLLWLAVGQRLYPIPYDWPACGWAVVAFAGCALGGVWVDASGLGWVPALALKALLLAGLAGVIVTGGLLPARDLRVVMSFVRHRLAGGADTVRKGV
jgi:O-antigen/teichoic acid export membrane protein